MALVYADRVQETTSTTGTGSLTLAGAATQFQAFGTKLSNGDTCEYTILSGDGTGWEVGIGTYTTSGNTLSRDTVYDGSSGPGVKISLSGTSTVFGDCSARRVANGGLYQPVMAPVPTTANTGLSSWLNQGTASVANTAVGVSITAPNVGTSDSLRVRYAPVPTPPYTISALIANTTVTTVGTLVGFGWYDGSAKLTTISLNASNLEVENWNSTTSINGVPAAFFNLGANPAWVQISDDNAGNYAIRFSADGYNFNTRLTGTKAGGFLGSTGYANFVFMVDAKNGPTIGTLMNLRQTSP